MTEYEKIAEELAQIIHEKDMKPGPPEMGGPTTINFIGATADRIAAALERQAKEGEIRGMEKCVKWLATHNVTVFGGVVDLAEGDTFHKRLAWQMNREVTEEITAEIARRREEAK